MKNIKCKIKKQSGQVIIILLLLMLVLLSIGLAITQRSITDVTTSTQTEQSSRALSAAEAGIEKALSGTGTGTTTFGNDSSATINFSALLPQPTTTPRLAIEYPPIGRETTAQFWFTDPATGAPLASSLVNGLVSYWQMDEGGVSSSLVADGLGAHNGSGVNTTIVLGKAGFGNARDIGSSNSYISIPDSSSFYTNQFTVAGWVYPTAFGLNNFASIINRRNSGNSAGFTLEYAGYTGQSNGELQGTVWVVPSGGGPSSLGMISTQKLVPNTWNHVALSYDGVTARLYIGGGVAASQAGAGVLNSNSVMSFWLGRNIISAQSLDGTLDDFGYWDRALTPLEITSLNSGTGNSVSSIPLGLIAYWLMDESGGTTLVSDSMGVNQGRTINAAAVPGKLNFGNARNFISSNSEILITENSSSLATDKFTVAAWVNPAAFPSGNYFSIYNRRGAGPGENIGVTLEYSGATAGQLNCSAQITGTPSSVGVTTYNTGITIPTGIWTHVACSYDGTTIRLYINGVKVPSVAGDTAVGTVRYFSSSVVKLGKNIADASGTPNGSIDDVGYWDRALTDGPGGEISQLVANPPLKIWTATSPYNQPEFDVYFGNENTTDKPAVEVRIMMRSNNNYYTRSYFLDSTARNPDNNFIQVTGCGSVTLTNTILSATKNFYCKYTISAIPDLGNPGLLCPNTTTNCQLILARARLLYANENHPIALAPAVSSPATAQFPPQIQIYNATGKSGQSEKQIRAFRVKDVVPPWFDFALFSVNEINK